MNTIIHCAAKHRFRDMTAKKLIYPAADQNKDPILLVLRQILLVLRHIQRGSDQIFLEIASGSGQHTAHFAPHFPHITFYPSESEFELLESIVAHANGFANIKNPLKIDITKDFHTWSNGIFKESSIDYMYNANILPPECSIGLFENAGKLLKENGILFTYGPYAIDEKIIPENNINFDKSIKFQNQDWSLKDIKNLTKLANKNGIELINIIDMPANNKTIIWKKNANV